MLYNEDCLTGMDRIPPRSIDMILSDLPYGTTRCAWDKPIDLKRLWSQYERIIKDNGAIVLFAQTPFDKVLGTSNLKLLRYEWIWQKTQASGHLNAKYSPLKAHENILVFYKKRPTYNPQKTRGHKPVNESTIRMSVQNKSKMYGNMNKDITSGGNTDRYPRSVLTFKSDKQKTYLHPTQKPLKLIEYLIKTYTNNGDIVMDSCFGSGTTAVACHNLDRRFIGFEIDKNHYKTAINRLNNL